MGPDPMIMILFISSRFGIFPDLLLERLIEQTNSYFIPSIPSWWAAISIQSKQVYNY
jgi:hypothetical protein